MMNKCKDQNQNDYFGVALYEREISAEVTGEFILPDYQCEIRRILRVDTQVLPPAKYVSASEVEFSGTVDFHVTYVGSDGELYCTVLSEAYAFSVPIEVGGTENEISVLCGIRSDAVTTRVSAPRKLSIRCRLRPCVRVIGKRHVGSEIMGNEEDNSIFRRMERGVRLDCQSSLSEIVPLSCVLPPLPDDVRIVSADATATVSSATCIQSGVRCQGKVCVKLLCVSDGGEFSTRMKEIPFETENEISLCEASVRAVATVCDMTVNVGDEGVECAMGVVSEVVACVNAEQEYTADAYSSEYECGCITAPIAARRMTVCGGGNATLSERLSLSETTIPADAEIIDVCGKAYAQSCESLAGKYVFSGNADLSLIWRKDGEFGAQELHIPIKYEHSAAEDAAVACFDASVTLDGLRCRIDGENLCVDAELWVSADCMAESRLLAVEALEEGERYPVKRAAGLTVCYPDPEDTLWSIAKRYKVSPASVTGEVGADRFVFVE